jgi:hypothetical protein
MVSASCAQKSYKKPNSSYTFEVDELDKAVNIGVSTSTVSEGYEQVCGEAQVSLSPIGKPDFCNLVGTNISCNLNRVDLFLSDLSVKPTLPVIRAVVMTVR